jgi:hypothetical protein
MSFSNAFRDQRSIAFQWLAGRALDGPIAADAPQRATNWRLSLQSFTDVTSTQTGQMPVLQD